MKILVDDLNLAKAKSTDLIECECYQCRETFKTTKKLIIQEQREQRGRVKFCGKKCVTAFNTTKKEVVCKHCGKDFQKTVNACGKSPNHFCTRSCASCYNNAHKKHGTRRSKLQVWLESRLPSMYPELEFQFNRKDAIKSELDVYIPSLKLAFELNGIFHYEPIFGPEKLASIQNNDERKFQACLEKGIEFCSIDTSSFGYFKEAGAMKYLNIIEKVINIKSKSVSVISPASV